jgi:hypothetical protein
MAEKSERKQHHGFKPGQSGNPKGKPRGARNHATRAVQALLDGEAEALTRKAVEKAMEGDSVALRLCLERLCPPRKDSPVIIAGLPEVKTAAELPIATGKIMVAVSTGKLTPSEGQAVAGILDLHRRALELGEIEARVSALEKEQKK